jgi:electron transfer flavoprotein beta subunit
MKIIVPVQLVPDLVEELIVDSNGKTLDPSYLRWILNEFDDHAIEEAILLKEKLGGEVIVVAPDFEGADDVLFTAAAKGADQLVKITGDFEADVNSHALARMFLPLVKQAQADLILTGVQAHNSLDGPVGPLLAEMLAVPYVGYVSGMNVENGKAIVKKEYPGGLIAEMEVATPAVLGIQAAETPPRYVAISKVRQIMKTSKIAEEAGEVDLAGGLSVGRMFQPEAATRAEMIEGDADEVAEKLIKLFDQQGLL